MSNLSQMADIWTLTPTDEDRTKAAEYASRTLPWTFNRMMKNVGVRGQIDRAYNIAKGIVAQESLRAELRKHGCKANPQRKSHRDEDLFDFHLEKDGKLRKYDVKSLAYYSDYPNDPREPFTKSLVITNRGYSGPDWRRFFPMLVPHTQINQPKEGYIFLISESTDFRKPPFDNRKKHLICAFPHGPAMPFYTYKKLCLAREAAGKGFYITLQLDAPGLFPHGALEVAVAYEWNKEKQLAIVKLDRNKASKPIGPMSVLNCLQLSPERYDLFSGAVSVWLARNEFKGFVPNSLMQDMNVPPAEAFTFTKDDFCDLYLPEKYKIHCLGWNTKTDFLKSCRKYPPWVWPIDSKDRFSNTPWTQLTERDLKTFEKAGFSDCLQKNPKKFNAGWMKTTGLGSGANCYIFPNFFHMGVRETNLYILPQDLQRMDELCL